MEKEKPNRPSAGTDISQELHAAFGDFKLNTSWQNKQAIEGGLVLFFAAPDHIRRAVIEIANSGEAIDWRQVHAVLKEHSAIIESELREKTLSVLGPTPLRGSVLVSDMQDTDNDEDTTDK